MNLITVCLILDPLFFSLFLFYNLKVLSELLITFVFKELGAGTMERKNILLICLADWFYIFCHISFPLQIFTFASR